VTARYAIYFAPQDDSELDIFGSTVLRRRAENPADWQHPELPAQFPEALSWADQIKRPAHYGFHATIKAPFTIADGQSADDLIQDLAHFCETQQPISLMGVGPIRTSRYDALAFPEQQPQALQQLANDCVKSFEKYRAPLSEEDLERRNLSSLTTRQQQYTERYGYPYILDDFNFHMTLSGQNDHNDESYLQWLVRLYESMVNEPPILDRLCIFSQPDRSSAFVRTHEFVFSA